MKIGDLARRTGSTTRQLRYYEEQGLLEPDRSGNNYRDYGDEAIEQVRQIKILVGAGIPTRIVRELLPCLHGPTAELPRQANPEMAASLKSERDRLQEHIDHLTTACERINCYLGRVQ